MTAVPSECGDVKSLQRLTEQPGRPPGGRARLLQEDHVAAESCGSR